MSALTTGLVKKGIILEITDNPPEVPHESDDSADEPLGGGRSPGPAEPPRSRRTPKTLISSDKNKQDH